jgi:hypothetical protein
MKLAHLLSILLLTTIITNCDSSQNYNQQTSNNNSLTIRTAINNESEFKRHQEIAASLNPVGNGYVVTPDNELLLWAMRNSSHGSGNFINKGGFDNPFSYEFTGLVFPKSFNIIGGKVFVNSKRIYDVPFLQKLWEGTLTQSELDFAVENYAVLPTLEDQKMLSALSSNTLPNIGIRTLAKKETWEQALANHKKFAEVYSDNYWIKKDVNFIVTVNNDMLIFRVGPFMNKLGNIQSNWSINGIEFPKGLKIIGGKVFLNNMRIYDVGFIMDLDRLENLTPERMAFAEKHFSIIPNLEDQELIDNFEKGIYPTQDITLLQKAKSTPSAAQLSADTPRNISANVSLRQARTAATGLVDGSAFKMNGVAGQSVELGLPLFVQLKGDVSSAKATETTTGSVAYRLGNTVIGAIQGYANSGAGFGTDSPQLETSVVASHSFGSFFLEGQVGTVSATEVHNSNWSGLRSQVTFGLDTAFVSPFVQLAHRQLNRDDEYALNDKTAYVGLEMEIANLATDTYSIDTRLLTKVGYGSKNWSKESRDLGSTSGLTGSVEWSASLNLNSGVAFSSNLALDTVSGSSAGLTVSLDRLITNCFIT